MILSQRIGDTRTFSIPLRWNGRPFVPGADWNLIFTVKSDPDTQVDSLAKIQKQSDYGISVSGHHAVVSLIPIDTAGGTAGAVTVPALTPGLFYWDIQAQSLTEADDIRSVAGGTLTLLRDVTRGTAPSIPIYVLLPPAVGIPPNGYTNIAGQYYTNSLGQYYTQPAA